MMPARVPLLLLLVTVLLFRAGTSSLEVGSRRDHSFRAFILYSSDHLFVARWDGHARVSTPSPIRLGMRNINAISVQGSTLFILGLRPESPDLAISLFDLPSLRLLRILPQPAQFIAADPKGRWIAALVPSADNAARRSYDIVIEDVANGGQKTLARAVGGYTSTISWQPSGDVVAFDASDGWITSVAVTDSRMTRITEGEAPAWSPDGSLLAYRRGRTVFVNDAGSRSSRALARRFFWQSEFVGPMYWSLDGKYLLANAGAGLSGDELTGVALEVASGRKYVVYHGTYWSGPWLAGPVAEALVGSGAIQ